MKERIDPAEGSGQAMVLTGSDIQAIANRVGEIILSGTANPTKGREDVQAMIRNMENASSRLYDLAQEGEKWGFHDRHNDAHAMAGNIDEVAEFLRKLDWRG